MQAIPVPDSGRVVIPLGTHQTLYHISHFTAHRTPTQSLVHDTAVSGSDIRSTYGLVRSGLSTASPSLGAAHQHGVRQLRRHLRKDASTTMSSRRASLAHNG